MLLLLFFVARVPILTVLRDWALRCVVLMRKWHAVIQSIVCVRHFQSTTKPISALVTPSSSAVWAASQNMIFAYDSQVTTQNVFFSFLLFFGISAITIAFNIIILLTVLQTNESFDG